VTCSLSSRVLEAEGWIVKTVATGEQALEQIRSDINVVLLDIYLPGIGGIKILPKIKQLSPSTQVVMLSGSDQVKDGANSIQRGAFDYLCKPVEKLEFIDTINRAFERNQSLLPESKRTNRAS
jgi:DNA-binding NtrC family response regulator